MALYKGFIPNWLRLGPWNIIVSFHSDIFLNHLIVCQIPPQHRGFPWFVLTFFQNHHIICQTWPQHRGFPWFVPTFFQNHIICQTQPQHKGFPCFAGWNSCFVLLILSVWERVCVCASYSWVVQGVSISMRIRGGHHEIWESHRELVLFTCCRIKVKTCTMNFCLPQKGVFSSNKTCIMNFCLPQKGVFSSNLYQAVFSSSGYLLSLAQKEVKYVAF